MSSMSNVMALSQSFCDIKPRLPPKKKDVTFLFRGFDVDLQGRQYDQLPGFVHWVAKSSASQGFQAPYRCHDARRDCDVER